MNSSLKPKVASSCVLLVWLSFAASLVAAPACQIRQPTEAVESAEEPAATMGAVAVAQAGSASPPETPTAEESDGSPTVVPQLADDANAFSGTFTRTILLEIGAVEKRLDARLVLFVALALGVGLALRRGLLSATLVVWRLGWDRSRRLARVRSIADITLMLVLSLLVLRKLMLVAPIVTWLSVAIVSLFVALALPHWIRDVVAGIALANRKRFREGDQVQFMNASGAVRHIGLTRTAIRAGDGGTISVPNREVLEHTIQVGREQKASPIEVVIPPDAADTPEEREMLLRMAFVNPFRRGGSRPTLRETERGWVLSLQTWSTRGVERARRALERQLLGKLDEEDA